MIKSACLRGALVKQQHEFLFIFSKSHSTSCIELRKWWSWFDKFRERKPISIKYILSITCGQVIDRYSIGARREWHPEAENTVCCSVSNKIDSGSFHRTARSTVSFTGIIEQRRTSAPCSHGGHHPHKQASLFFQNNNLSFNPFMETDILYCQGPRLNFKNVF